ncbi:MAG: WecB/TagA/CpsF family glycosyltransferase [Trueperaceae bacterium]|nr:WecB/TagA/CpsF family glycosyltransferase [Trueperaceae bacterium]
MSSAALQSRKILGMRVDASSYADLAQRVIGWAKEASSRYVCVANVHMVMESFDDPEFRAVVNGADLVTPDGKPLVWGLKALGISDASQVRGADLVLATVKAAQEAEIPLALYGGTPESLTDFTRFLEHSFPGINVVCQISPPFRPISQEEDEKYISELVASGARIVFVGIGCPKQENWMANHKEKLPMVMLGVGAAFDFHSGRIKQAPRWMQRAGLEWLFRLSQDPQRLWKRYAKHNPRFIWFFLLQLLGIKLEKRLSDPST